MENNFTRGEFVEVKDLDEEDRTMGIYLTTIEGAEYPYVLVFKLHEKDFHNGEPFSITSWAQIRKIIQPKLITITGENGSQIQLTKEEAISLGFIIN